MTLTRPSVFDAAVGQWQQYQSGMPGRLRGALLRDGLAGHLPPAPARILDVGGGTGELAVGLASAGYDVTLVDFSTEMVRIAAEAGQQAGLTTICAGVDDLSAANVGSFDVVVCHSVLEFIDDPAAAVSKCLGCLRPEGVLSVAFGNLRYAPVKTALVERDFRRALCEADAGPQALDCFGLRKRLFDGSMMRSMLRESGLAIEAEYGIRVVCDYLPQAALEAEADYDALLALERRLMREPALRGVARYIQIVARQPSGARPGGK